MISVNLTLTLLCSHCTANKAGFPLTTVCLCAHTPIFKLRDMDKLILAPSLIEACTILAFQHFKFEEVFGDFPYTWTYTWRKPRRSLVSWPCFPLSSCQYCCYVLGFSTTKAESDPMLMFIKCWLNVYLAQWINTCSLETLANLIFHKLLDTNTQGRGSELLNSSD